MVTNFEILATLLTVVIFQSLLPPANGQLLRTSFPRRRQCNPHTPIPVNDRYDLQQCRSEVGALSEFIAADVKKRTGEIILEHGYNYENHHVTTSDGYILTVHRILGGPASPPHIGKPAVLLQHGLGSCSDSWFALPSDRNLAFKLADAGYDVWIPDGRGADTSQHHVSLNADKDIEYWDFSFHEMGTIDLPAIVDLILHATGHHKIFYIGHSQGGGMYLVGASEIPELNDKIEAAFLLAPAAFLGSAYMPSFTRFLPTVYTPLETLVYRLSRGKLEMRDPRLLLRLLRIEPRDLCSVRALQCSLCDRAYFRFFDMNPNQYNYSNTPYISRMLNTGNLKSYIHFGQNILSCQFRKFDYGTSGNLIRYGTTEPPSYNLANVRAPVYIYYGEQDAFIPPVDIKRLAKEINPIALKGIIRVPDITFDHSDFVVARDADILVYESVVHTMHEHVLLHYR